MISYQHKIQYLLANGYTREEIAVETDSSFDAVRRWEKGTEPRTRHAQKQISELYRTIRKRKSRGGTFHGSSGFPGTMKDANRRPSIGW